MAITTKDLAKKKSFAKLIVEASGGNFDDWLAKKYDEVIQENEELLLKSVKHYKDTVLKGNHNQRV